MASALGSSGMKRELPDSASGEDRKMKKKIKAEEEEGKEEGLTRLDDNLLYEVLKHVDVKSLAVAACVNRRWSKTAQDERLWELICTKHWPNIGCANHQLRSVVMALGGFRRLHALYLCPLSKPSASSSSSVWASALAPMLGSKPPARWGKDEVHLSLSLLSIRYYEKMNFNSRTS